MKELTFSDLKKALKFAKEAHKDQYRFDKKTKYIEHPKAVFRFLVKAKVSDRDTLLASLLHDTVEDSNVTLKGIEKEFGKEISDLVDPLTRKDGQNYYDFIINLCSSDYVQAIHVKMADIVHNSTDGLAEGSRKDKYRFALFVLTNFLSSLTKKQEAPSES